jgi:hypothetical protein
MWIPPKQLKINGQTKPNKLCFCDFICHISDILKDKTALNDP